MKYSHRVNCPVMSELPNFTRSNNLQCTLNLGAKFSISTSPCSACESLAIPLSAIAAIVLMSSNIYTEASNILLSHKSGSLKSRIYSTHNVSENSRISPPRLYALIMETLKHQDLLNEVIKNSRILSIEKKVYTFLLLWCR